jgi:TonB family protein
MLKSLILCLAAVMPLAATASDAPVSGKGVEPLASTDDSDARYRLRWLVSLDATGHVTDIKAGTQTLVDVVRVPLENAIRGWRFVPGKVNGQPAETETMLTLDIALVPAGDKFNVRVEDARTGGGVAITGMRKPPHYPPDAIQHRWQGMVVLKVEYDGEGRVVAAKPQEGAPEVAMTLVRSAEKAVKAWSFSPEVVGGHAIAGSAIVPICFEIVPHGTRPEMRCDYTPPGARSALHDNDVFSLEPVAKLETDVIGRML